MANPASLGSGAKGSAPAKEDRDFTTLIGHKPVIHRCLGRIASGRFPPVIILAGMKGVGKGLVASTVAAGFFCDDGTACGRCPGCRQVMRGEHPELMAFYHRSGKDPAALANDDAKALQGFMELRPSLIGLSPALKDRLEADGRDLAKVVVVEDFDRFNRVAQNRLLKTLEEPPSYAHFILTTSEPTAILATIRSRAQSLLIGGLSRQETAERLAQLRQDSEPLGVDYEVLERLLVRHPLPIGYAARLVAEYGDGLVNLFDLLSRAIWQGSRIGGEERVGLVKLVKDLKIPPLVLWQFFELELNLGYREQFAQNGSRLPQQQVGRLIYRRRQLMAIKSRLVATTNSQLMLENLLFGR